MLFITNRAFKQSFRSKINRRVDFDLNQNGPCHSAYFCRRLGSNDYMEIGHRQLMQDLKKSSARQVLLLIHGFSCLPESDIFPTGDLLQSLFNAKEQDLVEVVVLIWPCDNDFGVVRDFWDDQKSADASAFAFARVLKMFLKWREEQSESDPCRKRLNILAHSTGNRLLQETLYRLHSYEHRNGVPMLFRNAFLMAADIINESLEPGHIGEQISHACRNVAVYYAADDLVLGNWKISNRNNTLAVRRLGHTGPASMERVAGNIYAIDCDNINSLYDNPKGHTYFLTDAHGNAGKVFDHMFTTIKTGRVPAENGRQLVLA